MHGVPAQRHIGPVLELRLLPVYASQFTIRDEELQAVIGDRRNSWLAGDCMLRVMTYVVSYNPFWN